MGRHFNVGLQVFPTAASAGGFLKGKLGKKAHQVAAEAPGEGMATDMHPPAALLKAALMHNKMSLEDGYDAIDQVFPISRRLPAWTNIFPRRSRPSCRRDGRSRASLDLNLCVQASIFFRSWTVPSVERHGCLSEIRGRGCGTGRLPTSTVVQKKHDSQLVKGCAIGSVSALAWLQ